MNDIETTTLVRRAEARFYLWYDKELRPELESLLAALHTQNLTPAGRAVRAMEVYKDVLKRAVRERIRLYGLIGRKERNLQMFSSALLAEYRMRIMTSVGHAIATLRDRIEMDFRVAGAGYSLPDPLRYVHLSSDILNTVNLELAVFEADGATASKRTAERDVHLLQSQPLRTRKAGGRWAEVETFVQKIGAAGYNIQKKDIWVAAGYSDKTEFQRFQNGSRNNPAAIVAFRRILSMEPKQFISLLRRRQRASS